MQPIKAKAYFLLARRPYFSRELSAKLLEKGYPKGEIDPLIKELTSRGYLNDAELAARFIESQKRRGYGPMVISHKLRQKAGEMDLSCEEDEDLLRSYIEKKHLKNLPEKKDKVIQSLMRKGHSYGLINKILATITRDDE